MDVDPHESEALVEARHALVAAIAARLPGVDFERALDTFPDVEAFAARMLEVLPDVCIDDPPIGACYSGPALGRWKQLTRQAIDQQRRAGTLFGVMVDRRWLYPSVQFDANGRQTRAFAELVAQETPGREPLEFAVWLETANPSTGTTPARTLREQPDTRTATERLLDGFVPTIIQPPAAAVTSGTDK
ncbi:hypothetical protein HD599_003245 [Conyzicola lurida]|uniref:Uncharacterized protein n=1 Tax=Conyzicola lurida TaxID=1172621 RepID=A0A841ASJ9_9MICO|nr:hypothetical protein [Conyzicola lurida]MBB5844922.1 hypothetical protein [Conyzicola lurida]